MAKALKIKAARPRGRPKKASTLGKPFPLRIPDEIVAAIDRQCAKRADKPTRAALIREILSSALT